MTSDPKIILGAIAAAMSLGAHIPYIITLLRGTNRPHIFTWVLWTMLTAIAFAAQVAGHAGPGAWTMGVTALMCIIITALTFTRGEKNITKSDWIMFVCGLAAIPVWFLTDDPLGAVIIITIVDALAYGPTIRKSWHAPHSENITMYGINIGRHILGIAALSNYTLVTALYAVMLLITNASTFAMLLIRRRQMARF